MSAEQSLRTRAQAAGLGAICDKVLAGERLSTEDGIALYRAPDVHAVGALANHVRERLHGDLAYFNVNQHVNYTNICNKLCRFCAFQRLPGQEGAYVMSPEEVGQKIREQLGEPVTEVHMVAGIYPKLPYSYYLDIVRAAKEVRPDIHVKAFTMIELMQIAKRAKRPLAEVLPELIEAGLGSCPGGGAEIFADRVHEEGYHLKNTGDQWIETARTVHEAGLKTNCTMLHGHIETIEERVDHLDRLRQYALALPGRQHGGRVSRSRANADFDPATPTKTMAKRLGHPPFMGAIPQRRMFAFNPEMHYAILIANKVTM